MPIQIRRRGARIVFREHIDRNGPAMTVAFADKQTFLDRVTAIVNIGDNNNSPGRFRQEQDTTIDPVAIFRDEADADDFLTSKGAGFSKRTQGQQADGFAFVITED